MTSKRQLEATAQGGAVQRGDHWLWHRLYRGNDVVQPRGLRRLAEFGDVGTGEKRAPGASDHHCLDRSIVARLSKSLGEPSAHLVLERVDRRVVDGDDRDFAVCAEIDAPIDVAHDAP